jgi:outer membrane immunogenic protein
MRRYALTLLAAAAIGLATIELASAADLGPVRRAPAQAPAVYAPPPPPPFSWTGFYIGGNLGVAWTEGNVCCDDFGNSPSISQKAVFTGGGQVGANYQWNWLVVGVEGDFDWLANNHNSSNTLSIGDHAFQFSANDRWIATVTGRVGYAFNWGWGGVPGWGLGNGGAWLIYGKGGWGWAGVNKITLTDVTTGGSIDFSNSNSNNGPVGGVGIEWAFAPNWTAKLEYQELFLNNKDFTVPVGFDSGIIDGRGFSTFNRTVQTVTVGINYLFNWH